MIEVDNKLMVKKLKNSIEYRSEHKEIITQFRHHIEMYFSEKYNIPIKVLTFGNTFGIELDYRNSRDNMDLLHRLHNFEFTMKILYEFCEEFECEFVKTTCDGDRYIFTFTDVDMEYAFILH